MIRRARVALKVVAWVACLAPLAALGYRVYTGDLTANPISFITNWLGDWTLRILLASLAMTPLRILFHWSWPVTLRRLLGLFAFFYASLHFSVWLVLDPGEDDRDTDRWPRNPHGSADAAGAPTGHPYRNPEPGGDHSMRTYGTYGAVPHRRPPPPG